MFHFENAYHIPNARVRGWACKTNLPSNTAFRGFGGPQGMFAGEHIIRDVAKAVGKSFEEVGKWSEFRFFELPIVKSPICLFLNYSRIEFVSWG